MSTFTIAKNPNSTNKPPSPAPVYAPSASTGGPALLPLPSPPVPFPPVQDDHQIDPFLLQALTQPKDRLTILKLDHELEKFLNSRRTRLDLPPMSSYQRLIVHRVAHHFRLHHVVVDPDGQGQKRAIILFKTPESRVPIIRFLDLLEEEQEPPPQKVKIMKRNNKSPSPPNTGTKPEASTAASNSDESAVPRLLKRELIPIEEREEAYLKARARIFNEEASAGGNASSDESGCADKEAAVLSSVGASASAMIKRPSSAGSGLERGSEAEERELEEREMEKKREKYERELERWRLSNDRVSSSPSPQGGGVLSPHPSASMPSHQFWAYGDSASDECYHSIDTAATATGNDMRLLDDTEECVDRDSVYGHGNNGNVFNSGGRRLGSSGGGGGKKTGRNRSPSPVKSTGGGGGGGYVASEGLMAQSYGIFVPSGRGRGGMDHGIAQSPFVPGFLRGPPLIAGAPFALADPSAFPALPSFGPSQGGPPAAFYPAYLPPPPQQQHQQQQYHSNYHQPHYGPFSNSADDRPLLSDYPAAGPYPLLPSHIPLIPGGPHGPYGGPLPSASSSSSGAASHLPLAIPPPIGVVPGPKGSYPFFPRGEYERPPPKYTELFDPKASTSSSSISSLSSSSSSSFSSSSASSSSSSSYSNQGLLSQAPPSRSYLASRAGGGSLAASTPSPASFSTYAPQGPAAYAAQQQQQKYHQQHQHQQQQGPMTSSYGDDGLSGPMGNMRVTNQHQPVWGGGGDHNATPFIYSGPSYHQHPQHHPHHNLRGGYGPGGGGTVGPGGGRGNLVVGAGGGGGGGAVRGGTYGGSAASGTTAATATATAAPAELAGSRPPPWSGGGGGLRAADGIESGGSSSSSSSSSEGCGRDEGVAGGASDGEGGARLQPQQPQPRVVSFSHILEVTELADEVRANDAAVAHVVDVLKKAGAANVKFLGSSSIIAIFKTASTATKALETVESSQFQLRPWVAPLSPGGPSSFGSGGPGPSPAYPSPSAPSRLHPPSPFPLPSTSSSS